MSEEQEKEEEPKMAEEESKPKSFLEQFKEEQEKESPGSSVVLITFIILVSSGLYDLIHEQLYQPNPCSMTYMYEYPAYIDLNVTYHSQHSNYKLFVYGEGQFAERIEKKKIFDGIPVLFLPGKTLGNPD